MNAPHVRSRRTAPRVHAAVRAGAESPPCAPTLSPSRQPLRTAISAGGFPLGVETARLQCFCISANSLCVTHTPCALTEHATRALPSPRLGRSPRRPQWTGSCLVLHARVRLASGRTPPAPAPRPRDARPAAAAAAAGCPPAACRAQARPCVGSGASVASGPRTATTAARLCLHTDTLGKPKASCLLSPGRRLLQLCPRPPPSTFTPYGPCSPVKGGSPAEAPEPRKRMCPPSHLSLWDVVLSSRRKPQLHPP